MDSLLFAAVLAGLLALDLALLRVLVGRTSLGPVLRHGSRRVEVAVSPFFVSSESLGADLMVPNDGPAGVLVRLDLGEDRLWRATNLGPAPVTLNGRPLDRVSRMFDRYELQAGPVVIGFRDARSVPRRPRFRGYWVRGRHFAGGASIVYPALYFPAGLRRSLLKVRDPSLEPDDVQSLNARVEQEFELLRRAAEGLDGDARRAFPEPHQLLKDGEFRAFAMENVRGPNLAVALRRPVRPEDALQLGAALARTLERLEERGLVHCDLKPGNVVLRGGRWDAPCLVDFGIAVPAGQAAIGGTAGYMSPEQLRRGTPLTPASDVWALGNLLEECLRACAGAEETRRAVRPLLDRMASPEPAARPSAREVRAAIESR